MESGIDYNTSTAAAKYKISEAESRLRNKESEYVDELFDLEYICTSNLCDHTVLTVMVKNPKYSLNND